jgi:hypothetical protein
VLTKKIILNNNISFSIEPFEIKARLVVYKNKEEWVCRKETIKNLYSFINETESRIFKGRLQLHKIKNKINLEVKGEVVGTISANSFHQLIPKPL